MVLEMRARMIARLGWAVGNDRALQIVTDGMKLDPVNPTIIQARDSIIAADNAGFGGADVADIRSGFATRGAGAGATSDHLQQPVFHHRGIVLSEAALPVRSRFPIR